jgi:hypothetical protein
MVPSSVRNKKIFEGEKSRFTFTVKIVTEIISRSNSFSLLLHLGLEALIA